MDRPDATQRWMGHNGVVIAGGTWGDPAGRPVILQHGGGQTRHAWKGTGEALGLAGYYAVAVDTRGHGDSDWAADGDYSQDAMIEDLACVVKALGNRPPVLVGASMGGGTSLAAVGEGVVDALALVLVDIAPHLDPDGVEKIRAFMTQRPQGFDSLDEAADAIASYQPHRRRPSSHDGLLKNLRLGEDGRYHWHWDPRVVSSVPDLDKREERLDECARALTIPTLLVRGALSAVLTEDGVARFRELCPHAEYVNVSGAAHMVAGDRNDIFAESVIEFLGRRVPLDALDTGGEGPVREGVHGHPAHIERIFDVP